jgi:DinB superfamily
MEFNIDRTIEILSATPVVIDAMLGGLSPEWIGTGTANDWGPLEIVGHLVHWEEADWIPRARIILDHGSVRPFEPLDRLAQFEDAAAKALPELISRYTVLRRENLAILRSWDLGEDQLDLPGSHPDLGVVTLRQLLATWAVHDLTHIRQLVTAVAKKYDAAVGPWREYLSILK